MTAGPRPRPRNIRDRIESGGTAYGVTVQLPSPDLVEIVGATGYDYAWLDAEHGALGLTDLREMIRAADACGIDSIVRVPDHDASFIQRVLDIGATGIMVPHLRTREEAESIVAAGHYSPAGIRGACPYVRATNHRATDWSGQSERADRDVLIFGLIEDREGAENVAEIAATPGLDGLVFGPFDLGQSLGHPGDVGNPVIRDWHDRVVDACEDAGIVYVTAALDWEFGADASNRSRVVTVAIDRASIFDTWREALVRVAERNES
ncbi:HpcH/HpaI aldolase family protein [Leifsonia naganoensis]|uniref:4-hydroxy-2-oxoheptanedioate aldolase n=1 Tax=Leifsonia naganoensis TaxID=150025 RepID=A0A853DWT2_9MICO|nr:aldolase/citrate lyase family protein [Leifsonia naganoensis]NYK10515.1 4-hydroxy-2-oxoheptanedioate aldolase [Leifsonia naganoensis]